MKSVLVKVYFGENGSFLFPLCGVKFKVRRCGLTMMSYRQFGIAIMLTALCILLSGCYSSGGSSYVDISDLDGEISRSQLDICFNGYKYDDKPMTFLGSKFALTPEYLYIIELRSKKKIDLKTGRMSSVCELPGCIHDVNKSDNCGEFEKFNPVFASENGLYITKSDSPGKLFLRDHTGEREVFENTFYTELNAAYNPDEKTSFSGFVHNGTMYLIGYCYMYTVDLNSMKPTSEPVVVTDCGINSAAVSGDMFWLINENLELIRYDMKNDKIEKVDDKVIRLRCDEEGAYYLKFDDDGSSLYFCGNGESAGKKLFDADSGDFCVTDNSIYYFSSDGLYMSSKNGENTQKIELKHTYSDGSEYAYHGTSDCWFIENSSCDSVFLVDYSQNTGLIHANAMFAIKKDTVDYQSVGL